ncbi:VanZ family protein [Streptomyces sp. NBC_01724]|uniref:VanZ family protein n=1 Tax=unclassified Streptomyces TaxID=2593676 RepID=UPI0028C43EAA|nr:MULTISPECIES: VanZ family protein [unclassified Streptomyces]WTE49516.1 VanZ family protein [Streptomyces sp. NBC_01620]WTE57603.1 VanZ family protein [Streptomyces sp. NBC_01617]WTI85116.1 VanZ family protein [Streptomyces sp. NBC_00724]WNO62650.1 VanZ family protein [Streptomyces sp. AM2-3-1]WSC67233.1 VanZ family protein [Streptomyces sp. NBC_01760]
MAAEVDREDRRRRVWGTTLLRALVLVATLLALAAFSIALAKVTLTPSPASEDLVRSNLRPGRSLRQYAEDYTFLAACKQAGGNLLLGVPFGILLPILVPRRLRMLRMVALTVTVMVVIELVQGALVPGRAFDIDDAILNTSGALLGYLLVGRRISHRYHLLAEATTRVDAVPEPKPKRKVAPKSGPKSKTKSKLTSEPRPKLMSKLTSKPKPRPKSSSRTKATPVSRTKSKAKSNSRSRSRAATGRSASGLVASGRALFGRLLTRDR